MSLRPTAAALRFFKVQCLPTAAAGELFRSVSSVDAMLLLGPMPDAVRAAVRNLVETARSEWSDPKLPFLGYHLWGGPGGSEYLDADGEVWSWSVWDDAVERITDGSRKLGAVAIAAQRVPELAEWLPRRPMLAIDCKMCEASGWLRPPFPDLLCPDCSGMGWLPG